MITCSSSQFSDSYGWGSCIWMFMWEKGWQQGVGCRIPRFWNANRLTIVWVQLSQQEKAKSV